MQEDHNNWHDDEEVEEDDDANVLYMALFISHHDSLLVDQEIWYFIYEYLKKIKYNF